VLEGAVGSMGKLNSAIDSPCSEQIGTLRKRLLGAGMQWGEIEAYLSRTFLDPNGSGLPSPDVLLGLVFTAVSFAIGWMASFRGSHRRTKARVIDELILSQSELMARAYPKVWRQSDTREAWMLDPFVARLRFLYSSVSETKSLSNKQLDLIENYVMRVQEFIAKWEETQTRRDGYHYTYQVTYHALRAATKALGLKEQRRLTGLLPVSDGLFGVSTPLPSNDQSRSGLVSVAMRPAE